MLSLSGPTLWAKEKPTSQLSSFLLKEIILDPVPESCSTQGLGWTFGLQVPPTTKKICGLSPMDFWLFFIISHGASYSFERNKQTTILVWQFYGQCHRCWWYQISEESSLSFSHQSLTWQSKDILLEGFWGFYWGRGISFFFFFLLENIIPFKGQVQRATILK